MNTSIPFLILFLLAGIFTFLSAVNNWSWWWRISGVGNWFYKRYGHEATRLSYGFIGMLLIVAAMLDIGKTLLATTLGKFFVIVILLITIGFMGYKKLK
ncbi:MAG: hypothetical protein HZC41_01225 [Chloroflexi bacterium]|nr:hypothetical protein [Chloroflexota bacterium]